MDMPLRPDSIIPYKVIPKNWDDFYATQLQHEPYDYLHPFYREPLLGSQQFMESTNFVALDIETTGLNAQEDDIVSIGLVPFDHDRIYLAHAKHWVVASEQLTSESVVVHRITHTEVAEAPRLKSILPELVECLQGKQVVVHYRYMEREFLRTAFMEQIQKNFIFPVIDTLELESNHLRKEQSFIAKLLNKQLPSLRLAQIRERYNLPAYESHNALVDALATAELLQAQMAKQQLSGLTVRSLWC